MNIGTGCIIESDPNNVGGVNQNHMAYRHNPARLVVTKGHACDYSSAVVNLTVVKPENYHNADYA